MHTFKHDGVVPVSFTYNSDLSGDIVINMGSKNIHIPSCALKAFMAKIIRDNKTNAIEKASDNKILGLRKK